MERSREFLVSVARRYYIDECSQQEIAAEFGISRPTVSNLLKQCKAEGIVQIHIVDDPSNATTLGDSIRQLYGLRHVVVLPSYDKDQDQFLLHRVGKEAAGFVTGLLRDGLKLGISWGTTLYQLVHQVPFQQLKDVSVVQLMGGLGAREPQYDGMELARELALRFHGHYFPLQCPVMVKSEKMKKMLLQEPGIAETIIRTQDLDVILLGIGSNDPDSSSLVRAGFLSREESNGMQTHGAVGHICGYSYDRDGKYMDLSANRRIVGIDFEDLRKVDERVGVACGEAKAQAVKAALRGGLLTTLITDHSIASSLLD